MPESPENELDEEELITCMGCGRIVPNYVHFCPHCGTPLSSLSTIDPYKRAFAAGNMYWRGADGAPGANLIFWVMVMFGVLALPVVLFLLLGVNCERNDLCEKIVFL